MDYDIRLGEGASAPVLLTVTDPGAADRIRAAIEAEREHMLHHAKAPVRILEVDRGPAAAPPDVEHLVDPEVAAPAVEALELSVEQLHAMNAEPLIHLAKGQSDRVVLASLDAIEEQNPRFPPKGRSTVRDAIQERDGELDLGAGAPGADA